MKSFFFRNFHPANWTYKHYLGLSLFMLAITLFGPRGIVHMVLLKQEHIRLKGEVRELERKMQLLREDIKEVKVSNRAKIHAIKEELGLLEPSEISFEIQSQLSLKTK